VVLRSISALVTILGLASCLEPPGYACSADAECVVNNVLGTCDLATARCIYPADVTTCPSGFQDGAGTCLDIGPGTSSSTSTTGTTTSSSAGSETTDSTTTTSGSTTDGSTTTTTTSTTDDSSTASTGEVSPCEGLLDNITAEGVVGASSVFNGFPPSLSVDGDFSTSWFSSGPEGVGVPAVYTWTVGAPRCINRVFLAGNGLHSNPDFRTEYGFESVTVQILDGAESVLFEESHPLTGTPDPDLLVDVPGVVGTRVRLELYDHESNDCGGFSELQVLGGPAAD
jgi:hypothetical protein